MADDAAPAAEVSSEQSADAFASSMLGRLPLEVAELVLEHVPRNERACTLRLVNKASAARFKRHAGVVKLAEPVPAFALLARWGNITAVRELNLHERRKLLEATAGSGGPADVDFMCGVLGCTPGNPAVATAAAAAGNLPVCKWLATQGCLHASRTLCAAARAGQHEVVEWLKPSDPEEMVIYSMAAADAARGGHVELAERMWEEARAQERCFMILKNFIPAVAHGCDLATLQRLYDKHVVGRGERLFGHSAEHSAKDIITSPTPDWRAKVEFLEARGLPRTAFATSAAAGAPDALDRLTWLHQRGYPLAADAPERPTLLYPRGYPLRNRAIDNAAHSDDVAVLCYLVEQGVVPDGDTAHAAARAGSLAALQFLHAVGCTFPADTIASALLSGRVPVVQWLVATAGEQLMPLAVACTVFPEDRSYGIPMLTWLTERGIPLHKHMLYAAIQYGSEAEIEWLAAHDCARPGDNEDMYRCAGSAGGGPNLAAYRALHRIGRRPSKRIFTCAVESDATVYTPRVLLELGCPVDWKASVKAASRHVKGGESAAGKGEPEGPVVVEYDKTKQFDLAGRVQLRWLQAQAARGAPSAKAPTKARKGP